MASRTDPRLGATLTLLALIAAGCQVAPDASATAAAASSSVVAVGQCWSLGAGVVEDIDWSPNGRQLVAALVGPDQSTSIYELQPDSKQAVLLANGFEIFENSLTVDDAGAIYYVGGDTPSIIRLAGSTLQTWPLVAASESAIEGRLEWTTSGLLGIRLTASPGGLADLGTLVRIELADGGLHETEIASWAGPQAITASGDGRTIVVAIQPGGAGTDTTIEVVSPATRILTTGRYIGGPLGLAPRSAGFLVLYDDTENGLILTVDQDGLAGPELRAPFDALRWDATTEGRYAMSPFTDSSGLRGDAQVCLGSIVE